MNQQWLTYPQSSQWIYEFRRSNCQQIKYDIFGSAQCALDYIRNATLKYREQMHRTKSSLWMLFSPKNNNKSNIEFMGENIEWNKCVNK